MSENLIEKRKHLIKEKRSIEYERNGAITARNAFLLTGVVATYGLFVVGLFSAIPSYDLKTGTKINRSSILDDLSYHRSLAVGVILCMVSFYFINKKGKLDQRMNNIDQRINENEAKIRTIYRDEFDRKERPALTGAGIDQRTERIRTLAEQKLKEGYDTAIEIEYHPKRRAERNCQERVEYNWVRFNEFVIIHNYEEEEEANHDEEVADAKEIAALDKGAKKLTDFFAQDSQPLSDVRNNDSDNNEIELDLEDPFDYRLLD